MPRANRYNGYSDLGIGVGLRPSHYRHILAELPSVDWFEIISENFMAGGGRPVEVLESVLEHYRVVQHGVSLYLGNVEPFDRKQLDELKKLTRMTKTPFVSDHLCWGSVSGRLSHDLLPLPYTRESVDNTAERIRFVRDYLELPVVIENVSSYLEYSSSTMTEWQFLSEVAERADCGILLDLNNIYVSARNHEFDEHLYLDSIPLERIAQVHLAGPSDCGDYLLDTHDHPVPDAVWSLYRRLTERTGPVNTLLEWDGRIPDFQSLHAEAQKAKEIK